MTDAFDLPTEIWLAIANLSGRRKAYMAVWSRVCQTFRAMFQPELFWLAIQENDSAITLKAAIGGNLDTLKIAASCGADLDTIYRLRTPSWLRKTKVPADKWNSPRSPEERLPEVCFGSLVHLATISGDYHVVRWLVDQQVDLEAPARFLCTCASLGTVPFSEQLTCGRDPSDFPPWTALHYALCKRQDSIARLLIYAGASCDDVRVPVSTALQKLSDRIDAASLPYPPARRFPKEDERYADNRKDERHPIPALHVAAASGRKHLVIYLVRDFGIDIETEDGLGAKAIHYAVLFQEHPETCEFRRDPGGEKSSDTGSESDFFDFFHLDSELTSESASRAADWELPMVELMISRLGADGYARFYHDNNNKILPPTRGYRLRYAREARIKFLLDNFERHWFDPPQASHEDYSVQKVFDERLVDDLDSIIKAAMRTHEGGVGNADLNSELSTAFIRFCSSQHSSGRASYSIFRSVGSLLREGGHDCLYEHEFDPKCQLDGFKLPRHATTNVFTLAFCFTISNWPKNSIGLFIQRILDLLWAMKKTTRMRFAGDMELSPLACLFKRMRECNSDPMDFAHIIICLGELGVWYPLQEDQSNLPSLFSGLVFTGSGSAGKFYDQIQKSMPEEAVDALQLNDLRRRCRS
ncbi:ankyrin repeat domain protein [Colletotrichum sojae]|uniref:Ankyrin repeat domain protein n=1 Tax=Colletotrichum sojae TaxID=2175907 RepID=A0A8H6ML60_9PEZI|nr:ankyrin repeat domain protein [Colletotrichum sojae]